MHTNYHSFKLQWLHALYSIYFVDRLLHLYIALHSCGCILTWGNAVEVSLMIIPGYVGYKITVSLKVSIPINWLINPKTFM
jgi:ABC-type Mn2+/Zn2+ transport system permease subunit